jgi:hypothetical protein
MQARTFYAGKTYTAILLAAFFLFSCATTEHFARVDDSLNKERYSESITTLESLKSRIYNPSRDMVLYYLDRGMLSHYAGEYGESSELLQNGERAIEEAFTKSITRGAGSFMVNDNVLEYAGEDYEDIYTNAFNALNYYHQGDIDGAMVEIRRMNIKLTALETKYDAARTTLQTQALADGVSSSDIPSNPDAPSKFSNSALARYLGMLFYRQDDQSDSARIDSENLLLAFANAPDVYRHPVPASIPDELEIPAGQARLNIIAFSGLSPVKQSNTMRIPLSRGRYVKISLPEMISRPSIVDRIEVQFDNGMNFRLELLEDIDAIARDTFKSRRGLMYTKSIVRAITKATTSSVLDAVSERTDGLLGLAFGIASLGSQVYAEASEQADLRVSRYFPARAWVGGINVDPGRYSFHVNFYGRSGGPLTTQYFENVTVSPLSLNLIEAFALR